MNDAGTPIFAMPGSPYYDEHNPDFFDSLHWFGKTPGTNGSSPLSGYGITMPSSIAEMPAVATTGSGTTVANAAGKAVGNATDKFKFGWNLPSVEIGLQGLQTLSNLWNSWKMAKLARDQFNWTKEVGNANLLNSIKSYNTNLTDRATSRGVMEGQTPTQVQSYIDANKLSR